jgi:hypothetical protein
MPQLLLRIFFAIQVSLATFTLFYNPNMQKFSWQMFSRLGAFALYDYEPNHGQGSLRSEHLLGRSDLYPTPQLFECLCERDERVEGISFLQELESPDRRVFVCPASSEGSQ